MAAGRRLLVSWRKVRLDTLSKATADKLRDRWWAGALGTGGQYGSIFAL